jgi:RNA-binding protein YlmH
MTAEEELLYKRFIELAKKSDDAGYFTFTDFLGLAEQSVFAEARTKFGRARYSTFGGTEGTERVMVRFGDAETFGYEEPFPILCVKIEPVSKKFADRLTHRDFLGALLNLGIDRRGLGDIPIIDNVGYLFLKEDIADFVITSLERVKHTDVRLSVVSELPEGELYRTEPRQIQLSGERIDAAVAKVFNLSREEALGYFRKRLVFVDGKLCENNSYVPKGGEKISVRSLGRFIYRGQVSTSKKGKLNVLVEVYV